MKHEPPATLVTTGSTAGNILFTTVRIETQGPSGAGAGTGFVYSFRPPELDDESRGIPLLLTNRHVVEGAEVGQVLFLHAADESLSAGVVGKTFAFTFTEFPRHWFYHPDPSVDLCLLPLALWLNKALHERGVTVFFRAIKEDLIPQPDQVDAIEGVYMVGYPSALMDDVNHTPIVRTGITATPWHADYKGRAEFLIDASVFPGSSGSPIFLIDKPWAPLKRVFFLGVLCAGYFRTARNEVVRAAIPTAQGAVVEVSEMIDLGVAIKSTAVLEIVDAWREE